MYVKEAYRLLQKSIIFVEADDIELEENEEVSEMILVIRIYVYNLFKSIIKFFFLIVTNVGILLLSSLSLLTIRKKTIQYFEINCKYIF